MSDDEQSVVWNAGVGDAWVRHADHYDDSLVPFGEAAMTRLAPTPGERVLDIGCGTGATTRELAVRTAPGEVIGIDLSVPMITEARRRSEDSPVHDVRYVVADVQDGWFEQEPFGGRPFDAAFSRFGVMFFPDPVRAFSRIAGALRPGGRLAFVCFKTPMENPFIVVPVLAAAAHLQLPPLPSPDAPGPFSLADPVRITELLDAAGFDGIEIVDGPTESVLAGADDVESLALRVLEQNPTTAPLLAAAPSDVRSAAVIAAAAAMSEYRVDDAIRMGAGSWVVSART